MTFHPTSREAIQHRDEADMEVQALERANDGLGEKIRAIRAAFDELPASLCPIAGREYFDDEGWEKAHARDCKLCPLDVAIQVLEDR